MKYGLCREVSRHSKNHRMRLLSWNPYVYLHVQKNPPLVCVLKLTAAQRFKEISNKMYIKIIGWALA
jgi:hypothetical protein